jgi:neutral ceramidase
MKLGSILLPPALVFVIAVTSQAQVAKPGPLRVGAAKVDITPAQSELPNTYTGILDHVYSRAILIDNGSTSAALITLDIMNLNNAAWKRLSDRIASEFSIPAKNIVITTTGTHSVPVTTGPAAAPGLGSTPTTAFDDKVVNTVKMAKEKLQPARMSYGTGISYVSVNRDIIDPKTHRWWEGANYDAPSDKNLSALKFLSLSGEPIAVYYNYGVFNVLAGTLGLVSGDITGATSRYLEDAFDNKIVAVLAAGAHGDQNPIYFQQTFDVRDIQIKYYAAQGKDYSNAVPPMQGLDRTNPAVMRLEKQQKQMVETMGQMLGEEVLHAVRNATREISTIGIYGDQKTVTCPGRQRTNTGRGGVPGTYKDADPVEIRLGLLMIGDVAVGAVNGGMYSTIGARLKKESPFNKTIVTTAANGFSNAGYIPDDASFGHETFEVLDSRLKPGCAESAIVNGIIDMMPPIMY